MIVLLLPCNGCVNLARSRRHFHELLRPFPVPNMILAARGRDTSSHGTKTLFFAPSNWNFVYFFFFAGIMYYQGGKNVEKSYKTLILKRESLLTVWDTKHIFVLHEWVANMMFFNTRKTFPILMCEHLSTAFPNCTDLDPKPEQQKFSSSILTSD